MRQIFFYLPPGLSGAFYTDFLAFRLEVQRKTEGRVRCEQLHAGHRGHGDHVLVQEVQHTLVEPQVNGEVPVDGVSDFEDAADLHARGGDKVVVGFVRLGERAGLDGLLELGGTRELEADIHAEPEGEVSATDGILEHYGNLE